MNHFFEALVRAINTNPAYTIPIFVFVISIFVNESIKIIGRFQERRNYRILLSRNYLIFKDYLIGQATNLKTFEQQISSEQCPDFNFYLQPCSAIANFKDISYNNAYKALFTGFENFSFRKKIHKVQAFDYLYTTISMFQLDQERIFPILSRFHEDVKPLANAINNSGKKAVEDIGDLGISVIKKGNGEKVQQWSKERDALANNFYIGDGSLNKSKEYYLAVLDFEMKNPKPITEVISLKEFWNYHYTLRLAISDIIKLERLINSTKTFCNQTSEKFKLSGFQLTSNYQFLFEKKLI